MTKKIRLPKQFEFPFNDGVIRSFFSQDRYYVYTTKREYNKSKFTEIFISDNICIFEFKLEIDLYTHCIKKPKSIREEYCELIEIYNQKARLFSFAFDNMHDYKHNLHSTMHENKKNRYRIIYNKETNECIQEILVFFNDFQLRKIFKKNKETAYITTLPYSVKGASHEFYIRINEDGMNGTLLDLLVNNITRKFDIEIDLNDNEITETTTNILNMMAI